MKKTKLMLSVPLIIVAILITVFLMALNNNDASQQAAVKEKPFPQFKTMQLHSSEMITHSIFKQAKKGEYTLLNVWASWCGVCKTEHSYLLKLAQQGVNIVGLNYRDDPQAARSLLEKTGNPYQQVIVDDKGKLALDLGVIGTPENYLINNQGVIVARFNGVLNQAAWEKYFQPIIATNGEK